MKVNIKVFLSSFIASVITTSIGIGIGYKLGENRQAARDKSAITDYITFVRQQDLDDCKDVLDQQIHACVKLIDEKCGDIDDGF